MPEFSQTSRERLETCHPSLIELFEKVVEKYDCTILEGHRGKEAQNAAADATPPTSHLRWPDGKHNKTPSEAADVAPYPLDWKDLDRFRVFAGYVLGVAQGLGLEIRWGGDWDQDWEFKDQNFNDLPHFEIMLRAGARRRRDCPLCGRSTALKLNGELYAHGCPRRRR